MTTNHNTTNRRTTTAVQIGTLTMGGNAPIVVQSMLNTSTMDTEACVEQAIRIIEAGGQLVRITAQGVREAENLKNIREELTKRGYTTPLSADIHFTPDAAMVAARYVEKVRINPGNFVDKRATFKELNYTDGEYAEELERLRSKFMEFLTICKEHNTAVRIGTNHGSLSDRIMSRYGNTPEGMVEATMEYLRICHTEGFNNVVISLKSSDCVVMTSAVRLLVKAMEKEGMNYPLHLGVTEAGEGEDGRIRSAIGIGTLLNEGIGDTIRVSLTEEPEAEIPVAKEICQYITPMFTPRVSVKGNLTRPVIVADVTALNEGMITDTLAYTVEQDQYTSTLRSPDIIYMEQPSALIALLPQQTKLVVPFEQLQQARSYNSNTVPVVTPLQLLDMPVADNCYVEIDIQDELHHDFLNVLCAHKNTTIVLSTEHPNVHLLRKQLLVLETCGNPVIVKCKFDTHILRLAAQLGGLLIDKAIAGIWLYGGQPEQQLALSRNLLQSAGSRRFKPEFISCPGCGRTLFNLQEAVAQVKSAFSHLNKLKIAVMGCVVNGPGEMGDADYGYVGAGNGKVNLYKGKTLVRIGIPQEEAINALRELIREGNDWQEK
ncbi:MAG: (E)-4-hydroxy-3-methylbut-2-enyl-diphosphate synthase [Marinifilaceae bacterium]